VSGIAVLTVGDEGDGVAVCASEHTAPRASRLATTLAIAITR
jgi:hypothetical protein